MTKKLVKHETIYYLRVGIFIPIFLMISCAAGLLQGGIAEGVGIEPNTFEKISNSVVIICAVCVYLLSVIISSVRFYKSFFSNEGYLNFTVPMPMAKVLRIKTITAGMFQVLGFITAVLSFFIGIDQGIRDSMIVEFKLSFGDVSVHSVFYVIELVIYVLLGIMSHAMFIFLCISLGQAAKKLSVLVAVGTYIGAEAVMLALSAVYFLIMFFFVISVLLGPLVILISWSWGIHLVLAVLLLPVTVGVGSCCYFLIHLIMKKKFGFQ